MICALVVVPAGTVIILLGYGMAHSGSTVPDWLKAMVFATPPVVGALVGARRRRWTLAIGLAVGALLMIAVSYAVLFLPAAAACSVISGDSCM